MRCTRNSLTLRPWFGAILASLFLASGAQAQTFKGLATIVDGDTITVEGHRVRLWGIDAPEAQQRCEKMAAGYACGAEATKFLAALTSEKEVSCRVKTVDRYQRSVAICAVDGQDIGAEMVRAGWALAFIRYSSDYATVEADARENRRGLWAGTFTRPWEWRAGQRQ